MDINIIIFLAGMSGALVSDILKDNALILPTIKEKKFYLGFISGAILGGVAGMIIDGGIDTAFMGGFMGKQIIENMVIRKAEILNKTKE